MKIKKIPNGKYFYLWHDFKINFHEFKFTRYSFVSSTIFTLKIRKQTMIFLMDLYVDNSTGCVMWFQCLGSIFSRFLNDISE